MPVIVVTDSSSRLEPDELKQFDIRQVPLHVLVDGQLHRRHLRQHLLGEPCLDQQLDSSARVPNKSCALAALSMRASFSAGDLAGGIVTGLRMMSDAAGRI